MLVVLVYGALLMFVLVTLHYIWALLWGIVNFILYTFGYLLGALLALLSPQR